MSLPVMKIDLEISLRRLGKVVDGMQNAAATSWPGPDTGGTCSAGAVSGAYKWTTHQLYLKDLNYSQIIPLLGCLKDAVANREISEFRCQFASLVGFGIKFGHILIRKLKHKVVIYISLLQNS